jgi:predicted  nucleic acid-binding Zn-ribbon protein
MKELNKTIQDLKVEIETIRKSQRETTLEIENLGKRPGVIDANITNRIKEIEGRISGGEDTIENIDNSQSKCKMQKAPNPKQPGNPGHSEKTKPKGDRYRIE